MGSKRRHFSEIRGDQWCNEDPPIDLCCFFGVFWHQEFIPLPAIITCKGEDPRYHTSRWWPQLTKNMQENIWRHVFCWSVKGFGERLLFPWLFFLHFFFRLNEVERLNKWQFASILLPLVNQFAEPLPAGPPFTPPNGGWPPKCSEVHESMPRDVNRGLCSVLGAVCTWWCSQLDGFQTSDKRGGGREDEGMGPGDGGWRPGQWNSRAEKNGCFVGDDEKLPRYVEIISWIMK